MSISAFLGFPIRLLTRNEEARRDRPEPRVAALDQIASMGTLLGCSLLRAVLHCTARYIPSCGTEAPKTG